MTSTPRDSSRVTYRPHRHPPLGLPCWRCLLARLRRWRLMRRRLGWSR